MQLLTRIFNYEYLSKDQLAGFDKYKYSCVDNSPLSRYVMHPFWDQMVKIYPKWLAPNLITFTGFMCLIVQWVLFTIYDSHFYGYCFDQVDCSPENEANLSARKLFFHAHIDKFDYEVPANVCSCIPHWLWLVLAITQFLSHHLDGTDGKQARRTGSSSPLGELFDHGLDSWATLFLPVALFSIFGRSDPYGIPTIQMYGFLWVILVSFIISHWEKYNTGILFLPWSYDLSQLGMTFLFFMTYLNGQSVWYFTVFGITFTQVVVILVYTCAIGLSVPFTIYNMYKAFANKTMKQSSLYEAIRPILSTIYLFILQLVWIKYSTIEILQLEPRVFFWLTGTLFSNISCRLIVAQMTSTRCEIFNWCLIPLTLVVTAFSFKPLPSESPLGALLTSQAEVNALYFMAFLVTVSHIHYGICMVRQICKHLNIYCFTITSKPAKSEEKTK